MNLHNRFFFIIVVVCLGAVVQVFAQQLPNPCKHNEFRCSDGSKCLATENLCNGKRDCPRGEDEKGSEQWDCTKRTLSTDCDQTTQVKCRYGGCVLRTQVCDGTPDCWGGNDESTDLCSGRRDPPKPRPQRPPSPPADPFPPQETPGPTPRPRPRPPHSPQTTSQQTGNTRAGHCQPLNDEDDGFKITCKHSNGRSIDCNKNTRPLPIGTQALYTCKSFYKAPDVGSSKMERTCESGGRWSHRRRDFFCTLDCGEGGYDHTSLIVGGYTSRHGKWPWHVALYHQIPPNSGNWEYSCGGSLISANAILTAAHCATINLQTTEAKRPQDIRIILGKFYKSYARQEKHMQLVTAKRVVVHEEYYNTNVLNDIAIIFLEKNVEMTEYVHPICLPHPHDVGVEADGETFGHMAGWGRGVNDQFKEELQEAKLPIIPQKSCRDAHPTLLSIVRDTTFCAGYRNGTSACDGDSGSPLVFPDFNRARRWKVEGIVSAGVAKPGGGCQNTYYSVFTKVVRYRDWINDHLDQFSTRR